MLLQVAGLRRSHGVGAARQGCCTCALYVVQGWLSSSWMPECHRIGVIETRVMDHRVVDARMRGTIEPFALAAAVVAAAMAVFYVWLIRQQGDQPLPWVLIVLLVGALLAAYGALWRVPYRRMALVPAVIALTVLGVLGILSIGLPILASGILALVSLLRPRHHKAL